MTPDANLTEAVDYVLWRLSLEPDLYREAVGSADIEALITLFKGDLPTIERACWHMVKYGLSPAHYLTEYAKTPDCRKGELLPVGYPDCDFIRIWRRICRRKGAA